MVLLVLWYCYKRGKEVRLDREAQAVEDAQAVQDAHDAQGAQEEAGKIQDGDTPGGAHYIVTSISPTEDRLEGLRANQ